MELLTSTVSVFADWHHDGPGWWIVFPLFWLLVLIGVVFLVRARGPWGPPRFAGPTRESALDVLDRRYAQGDIGLDEYQERRAVLEKRPESQ